MNRSMCLISLLAVLLGANSATANEEQGASASFLDAQDQQVGTAQLSAVPSGGVLIDMELTGLPANQWIAVHIHETGNCDHGSGHASAGGHFNPTASDHGFHSENGPHSGDLPNQYIGADGVLRAQIHNAMVSLDQPTDGIRGRAIMVHAGADDYASQPAGDAGARIACAVVE